MVLPGRNGKLWVFLCIAVLALSGCTASSLEQASDSYKKHRDYASLEMIHRHLTKGMKRTEVERLLGESDYSPVEGQHYYSSDKKILLENKNQTAIGLVLDYRGDKDVLTEELQKFWMGPIGE